MRALVPERSSCGCLPGDTDVHGRGRQPHTPKDHTTHTRCYRHTCSSTHPRNVAERPAPVGWGGGPGTQVLTWVSMSWLSCTTWCRSCGGSSAPTALKKTWESRRQRKGEAGGTSAPHPAGVLKKPAPQRPGGARPPLAHSASQQTSDTAGQAIRP